MDAIRAEADYLQLVLHNDERTPSVFVLDLIRAVFSRPAAEAMAAIAMIKTRGKAVCGTYPRAVAEAMLETAQRRIRASGHPLVMTAEAGEEAGRDCKLCGDFAGTNEIRLAGKT